MHQRRSDEKTLVAVENKLAMTNTYPDRYRTVKDLCEQFEADQEYGAEIVRIVAFREEYNGIRERESRNVILEKT